MQNIFFYQKICVKQNNVPTKIGLLDKSDQQQFSFLPDDYNNPQWPFFSYYHQLQLFGNNIIYFFLSVDDKKTVNSLRQRKIQEKQGYIISSRVRQMHPYHLNYLEIPNDDKLIIRRKIKQNEDDVISLFVAHKKNKNYHDLQVKLRKIIQSQKNCEKRYTINHFDRDRKKSEYNQRIYSQGSQNASFKNSVKASPQKQQHKKHMITFDICELKKKIQNCSQDQNKITFHIDQVNVKNQKRINSINKVNNSLNKSRQNSLDRLPLKEKSSLNTSNININQNGSKIMNSIKTNPSKITLRINNDRRSPCKQNRQYKPKIEQQPQCFQQKIIQHQNQNVEISYSSSIKNLLLTKLKNEKQIKKEKIVLKDSKKYGQNLISNRSISEFYEQTSIKRATKPMVRDQIEQYHKQLDENYQRFPMYIHTTEQSQDERKTKKILQDFGYNKASNIKNEKMQTSLNIESQQQKYGHFYLKIKSIINSKNY